MKTIYFARGKVIGNQGKFLKPKYICIFLSICVFVVIGMVTTVEARKVTITAWVGDWWKDNVPKIIEAFEKEHPDIALKIELIPNVAYLEKVTTSILGGNPPDVIDLGVFMITSLVGKNLLQPWEKEYIDRLGDLKDFSSGIWNAGIYNGKVYAIPNRSSSGIYLYNKNMFDAASVPYPKEDWTYQDMLEVAKKLTIPGKQHGFGMAGSITNKGDVEMTICPMVWAFGGDFFDKDYTVCTLNQPNAVRGLQFWAELHTKHKVVPEGVSNYTLSKDIIQMFVNDKVAIMPGGDFAFRKLEEQEKERPSFKWGIQFTPNKVSIGGGWSFTIPVYAKNSNEAREFILWFVKPENLGRFHVRQPARLSATKVPPWNTERYRISIQASPVSRPLPLTTAWAEAENIIITQMQKVLEGKLTPSKAADEIVAQVNPLLKRR